MRPKSKVRPFTPEDIHVMRQHVSRTILNDSFDAFVQTTHWRVPKNEFFRVKPDAFYARYFPMGSQEAICLC